MSAAMDRWRPLFEKWGAVYGVEPRLLDAICYCESGGDANARGAANANGTRDLGLMQLNPKGALDAWASNGHGARDPMNADNAVEVAAWYLGKCIPVDLKRLGVPVTRDNLIISYNAGPGGARAGRTPTSTVAYLGRVLARYAASSFAADATRVAAPVAAAAPASPRTGASRGELLGAGALALSALWGAIRLLKGQQ